MNEITEKITPIKNSEDHNKLIQSYEEKIEKHKQETLDWKNACIKKDEVLLEKSKEIEKLTEDRDDWKTEAHSARRIQSESKQTKEANDFKSEFIKLQSQKRGWTWDETKGWVN